ncbi:LuxR C-terminal-related transcriptional regulator [Cryobacterium sp. Y82]|uniref:LuxR C-terminal-related transcriptional regulator n=1 Tax=Cryobacterium sp. Y82 TaxID=2045017 RepID=UPI000CE54291|nr:LuxR C-terminal-related transcriptional regulator [Cryobacterium sp. Y82]
MHTPENLVIDSSVGLRDQLDTVTDLARDLAGRFELAPLLERILGHAIALLGCESGSISLDDEASRMYTKKVDLGVGCHEGQTFSLDEGVTGEVVHSRGTVILDEYASVLRAGHIAADDPRLHCAVIGVPIKWDDSIVGTCVIFSATPGRVFTTTDAKLAELFAHHAAIALANSTLYAKAADRTREAAVAAERERAVRDVHETVGRSLASLLLHLDEADRANRNGEPAAVFISSARTVAHDALTETRRTALGLGPASLEGRTLDAAIDTELAWVESMCMTTTELVIVGTPRPLAPEIAHQTFKIVQEALSNVVSHASAGSARVGLVYDTEVLSVLIDDDGRGFDLAEAHGGHFSSLSSGCLGLHGMMSRASHLDGELVIDTTPGWGTKIRATIPYISGTGEIVPQPRWKVLIANDQPIISAGLVRLLHLSEPAIQVTAELSSGRQLVDAYEMLRPDVLIVDLRALNGELFGTLAKIREFDPNATIVVLTENPTVDQIRSATQANVRGFLSLKSDAATISRVIIAACRGEALLQNDILDHLTVLSSHGSDDDTLTPRERQVRPLVEQGMADKQIASMLFISVKTVEKHVGSLLRKTGAHNRTMLVHMNRAHASEAAIAEH